MSIMGTFDTFTAARLAIYASQKALSVTGNNIANINTTGYTRQSLDQVALKTGGSDRYQAEYDAHVGSGVLCTGVSQTRDAYLDIRYRNEMASVGQMDTKLSGLNDLADILDEVGDGENEGDGIVEAQLNDLFETLENLDLNAGDDEYDAQVRASASSLCTLLNSYAKKLEELEKNTETQLKQDVEAVNEILTNIRELNQQIRKSEIHGDSALEMRDDRNVLLDQLAEYMKIDVTYEMEDLGGGQQVEKLVVKLGNANPDSSVATDSTTLIDGVYGAQISVGSAEDGCPVTVSQLVDSKDRVLTSEEESNETKLRKDLAAYYEAKNGDQVTSNGITYTAKDVDGKIIYTKNENGAESESNQQEFNAAYAAEYNLAEGNTLTLNHQDGTTAIYTVGAQQADGTFAVTKQNISSEVALDDNDLYGSIQATRELLTESGEFASDDDIKTDESAATKRGIPYYQKALDLLANQIATQFNRLNQQYKTDESGNYLDATGNVITGTEDGYLGVPLNQSMTEDEFNAALKGTDPRVLVGNTTSSDAGALFSNSGDSNDTSNITAKNISVSSNWANGSVHIVNSFNETVEGEGIPSTASDNIDRFVALFTQKLNYYATTVDPNAATTDSIFSGTMQEMLTNMSAVLGNDIRSTNVLLETYNNAATELDTSRDAVSGVDLNDEAMGLMQYQKSYAAACRLMTTLDEVLDKLINGTAV